MTLRSRLLIGFVVILAAFMASAYFVISSQRNYLLTQIDRQLEVGTPGAMRFANQRARQALPGGSGIADPPPDQIGRAHV